MSKGNESSAFLVNDETPPLPFSDEKISAEGNFVYVYKSSIDDGYIVKETKTSFQTSEAQEKIEAYKNDYKLLKQYLGKHVPHTFFTTIHEPDYGGTEHIKIVQERVIENLTLSPELVDQRKKEIELFMLAGLAVFEASFDNAVQSGVFMDLKKDNVIFGHTISDPEDRLYFIDTSGVTRTVPIKFFIALYEARMKDMGVEDSIEINARFDQIKALGSHD